MSGGVRGPTPMAMVKIPTSVPRSANPCANKPSRSRGRRASPADEKPEEKRDGDHALRDPSLPMLVAVEQDPEVDRCRRGEGCRFEE